MRPPNRVIFSGQGAAQSAMEKLQHHQLERLLPRLTQPVLGICLGMQLLCTQSEEGDTQGLGIIDATVTRFNTTLKVPQMGWNTIHELQGPLFAGIPNAVHMYLVPDYYVPIVAETTATAHYEIPYTVAVAKDNFFGVQFHPEKSDSWGQKVLEKFYTIGSMNIIPAIDIIDGKCVRLSKGDFLTKIYNEHPY